MDTNIKRRSELSTRPEYFIEVLPNAKQPEYVIELLDDESAPAPMPATRHIVHIGGERMVLTNRGVMVYRAAVIGAGAVGVIAFMGWAYVMLVLAGTWN